MPLMMIPRATTEVANLREWQHFVNSERLVVVTVSRYVDDGAFGSERRFVQIAGAIAQRRADAGFVAELPFHSLKKRGKDPNHFAAVEKGARDHILLLIVGRPLDKAQADGAARAGEKRFLDLLVCQRRSIAVALHVPAFLDDAVGDVRREHEERVDLTHCRVLPHRLRRRKSSAPLAPRVCIVHAAALPKVTARRVSARMFRSCFLPSL